MKLDYEAVVFDFDGVLVESNQIKHEAFSKIFCQYPEHYDEIMKYHYDHHMVDRYSKFEYILSNVLEIQDAHREELRQKWITDFRDYTRNEIIRCNYVVGAIELLDYLQNNSLLFVASATPQDELEIIIEKRGLGKYFKKIYGAPIKKDQVLMQIKTQQKLNDNEILFIGDSKEDYLASLESGVPFIGRKSDYEFLEAISFSNLKEINEYFIKEGKL